MHADDTNGLPSGQAKFHSQNTDFTGVLGVEMMNAPTLQGVIQENKELLSEGASLHWLIPFEKRPIAPNWTELPKQTETSLVDSYRQNANIGIRLGEPSKINSYYLHIIDIDIRNTDLAGDAWGELLRLLPEAKSLPSVISGSGGESRHIYLLTEKPFRKKKLKKSDGFSMIFDRRLNREVKKYHWEIDLMGTGSQAVVPPSIHPDTKKPYRWERPLNLSLIGIGVGPIVQSMRVAAWGADESGLVETDDDDDDLMSIIIGAPMNLDDDQINNTLRDLPADWVEDRDHWLTVGAALHHQFEGKRQGFDRWCEWSKQSAKFDAKDSVIVWKSFKGSKNPVRMATLIQAANRAVDEELGAASDWHIQAFHSDCEPDLSHDQLALNLGKAGWDRDARYVPDLGGWLLWNGQHWETVQGMKHMTIVRAFLRSTSSNLKAWAAEKEPNGGKITDAVKVSAKSLRQDATVAAVERTARSNQCSIATADMFDADTMALGTPAGTVDLGTGELRPARRIDYLTRQTAVAPADAIPVVWLAFLERIFNGDVEIVEFMQRLAGYCLTGETREHKFFFAFGTGRNGKSTFIQTLREIMGDYAKTIPSSVLLESRNSDHPTGLAGLRAARLAVGSEIPAGKTWNESIIKDLTGGDVMTARLMRQDFFEFQPQCTLFVNGNRMPAINGVDEAIRKRMILIPFKTTIQAHEVDPKLPEKLKAEYPSILNWSIEGAVKWNRDGLKIPMSVAVSSKEYLDGEDTMGQFIKGNLVNVNDSGVRVRTGEIFERFQQWQLQQGIDRTWSSKAFSRALMERGLTVKMSKYSETYGVKMLPVGYDSDRL